MQPDIREDRLAKFRMWAEIDPGNIDQARSAIKQKALSIQSNERPSGRIAFDAAMVGDFDTAGEMLLQAYRHQDGTWLYPEWIRLPEQAPDSEPWQEFWRQPGVSEIAEIRRSNGLSPHPPKFGDGKQQ